jgi:hypothetical protein
MKKIALVLILCAAALGAVSALEAPEFTMAAGGGGFFSLEPGGGVEKDPLKIEFFSFGGGARGEAWRKRDGLYGFYQVMM